MRRSHQPVRRMASAEPFNCAVVDHGAVEEGDEAAEGRVQCGLLSMSRPRLFVEQDSVYCGEALRYGVVRLLGYSRLP